MFEMEKIGRRIAQLRKQRDMTQMELADRLNISYQAVSNWERGQSMPDIAKLGELSTLLNATIDEILENERGALVIQSIHDDTALSQPIAADELVYIAPLMKPTQVDHVVSELRGRVDLSELTQILPFISDAMLDEIAWDCYRHGGLTQAMQPLAPFISDETMDALVQAAIKDGKDLSEISGFFPFIGEEALQAYAEAKLLETGELSSIASAAPFLDDAYIDALAVRTAQTKGLNAIACIAPFVSDETINQLAREALEKDGIAALSPIMPFIDEDVVEAYLRKKKPYIK